MAAAAANHSDWLHGATATSITNLLLCGASSNEFDANISEGGKLSNICPDLSSFPHRISPLQLDSSATSTSTSNPALKREWKYISGFRPSKLATN
jgi:hypothetical protein